MKMSNAEALAAAQWRYDYAEPPCDYDDDTGEPAEPEEFDDTYTRGLNDEEVF